MTAPRALSGIGYTAPLIFRIVIVIAALDALVFFNQSCQQRQASLSEDQISAALRDNATPNEVREGLDQLRTRIVQKQSIERWAADVVRLSNHPEIIVRHDVAEFMAADPGRNEFRAALHRMLESDVPLVCNAAALSLAAFDDNYGHELIAAMLKPVVIMAPRTGNVRTLTRSGKSVEHGTVILRISAAADETAVLAPIAGKTRLEVKSGDSVSGGARVAVIEPAPEQLKAALRALQSVGKAADIPQMTVIAENVEHPAEVRELARTTIRKISERARF